MDIREEGVEVEVTGEDAGDVGQAMLSVVVAGIKRLLIGRIIKTLKEFIE